MGRVRNDRFDQAHGTQAMRTIDIDRSHSFAIVREIGERLRALLQEKPELPPNLEKQMRRLRELDESS